jgi:ABC-type glycerol-3-phosphate transport system substrate-binding protein
LCKKVKSKGIIPLGIGAMDGWNLSILLSMITAQTTGSSALTSGYGSDAQTYQNLKGMKDAFNIFGKLNTSCIPSNSIDVNYRQSIDDFVKGKSAILPTGSWAIDLIEQIKPNGFHYKVFNVPVSFVDNPITLFSGTAGQVIAIPSNSKNKKEALKLLEYLYSEDAQKIIAEKGYFSPLVSANKGESTIKKLVISHLELTDDNSILFYDNLSSKMSENTSRILQDIVEGRVKSQEGWSRIVKLTFQK